LSDLFSGRNGKRSAQPEHGVDSRYILDAFRHLPMQRYRILFLHDYAILGGAERSIAYLSGALDRSRFDPIVMMAETGALDKFLRDMGIPTIHRSMPYLR